MNELKYVNGEFVYVANAVTTERERQMTKNKATSDDNSLPAADLLVAKIIEIRPSDEHHVYARVYWMYWPDELRQNTKDGKRTIGGRQAYHGQNELIASNHSTAQFDVRA